MSGRGRKGLAPAIGLILAMLVLTGVAMARRASGDPSASGAPVGKAAFCSERSVNDFGRSALPPVEEIAPNGESGKEIGHPAVSIYGGQPFVVNKPVAVGYGFANSSFNGPLNLHWTVDAQLWSISSHGVDHAEVGHTKIKIDRLGASQPHIQLKLPDHDGFYRFDLQIVDAEGKTIGSWSNYEREVPPSWHVRLRLNRTTIAPGETLYSHVENFGSEWVYYGDDHRVQHFEDGSWHFDPDLNNGWSDLVLYGIPGGGVTECGSTSLPSDTPPGRYRIVKEVGPPPWPRGHNTVYLRAPFEVVAGG